MNVQIALYSRGTRFASSIPVTQGHSHVMPAPQVKPVQHSGSTVQGEPTIPHDTPDAATACWADKTRTIGVM